MSYEEDEIRVEKTVKSGKRTDIHCIDEYGNVTFVVEFKKPSVTNLDEHKPQLWERYMKPLRADYGLLYNGLEIIFYERISNDYNRLFKTRAENISEKYLKKIINYLKKPDYDTQDIEKVLKYFSQFDDEEERMSLKEEASREHFFQNFQLDEDSEFGNLLKNTIKLFKEEKGESKFLDSAYDFWKQSYAKKPESIPKDWKPLMEEAGISQNKEELYKFMFCLETAYAVFARLILAKSGEDYGFPDVEFREFIERKVKDASHRGDISQSSYAKITEELIKNMRWKLVSSVFEEDIFYWWTEPFKDKSYNDLFGSSTTLAMGLFGQSLAKMLLMIYKYDFSEIKGDPLGVLYQKYFDKETRKALGEFYTPQEVVDYILDSVEYEGRKILDKRLLDPACGSGTFIVTALQRYLEASEEKAEKRGWDDILDDICNKYRLVGFDIHPFATIMAQIQFMLVLLPYYKKAVEDADEKGERFTLQRVPIFRTDSLVDESKGENSRMSLRDFEEGSKVVMDIKLPVTGSEKSSFFETEFEMPDMKTVRTQSHLDIHNNEEYFATLQALFDTVKQQAQDMEKSGEVEDLKKKQFQMILKRHYLSNKNFEEIAGFFKPFAQDLLEKIHRLQTEFDDGRLIKSIEDIFLAALLKNEQKYDYVVGNPPYVRQELIPKAYKKDVLKNYEKVYSGRADLYVYFYERGMKWLNSEGKLSYITSNKFFRSKYGKGLRNQLLEYELLEIVNFGDNQVFDDATNYTCIVTLRKNGEQSEIPVASVKKPIFSKEVFNNLSSKIETNYEEDYFETYFVEKDNLKGTKWSLTSSRIFSILIKLNSIKKQLGDFTDIRAGMRTGANSIFIVGNETIREYDLENELLHKCLRGRNVRTFNINWNGEWVIYTNKIDDLKNYPNTQKYLQENKDRLNNRAQYQSRDDMEWYEIEQPVNPDYFESSKIVTPSLSNENNFAYDKGKFYTLDNCFMIKSKNDYDEKYLTSLLNSRPVEFFIKQISPYVRDKWYAYKKQYLERIPIPSKQSKKLNNKAEKLIQRNGLERKLNEFPGHYINSQEMMTKTLNCNSGHSNISPSIQETQDGMYGVIVGKRKKEDPILVDTKEKARYVKLALEGKNVKKNEEIEVLVPKSNNDVKEILEEYEEDKKKLNEMPTVEELEEEINEIVYDLYGLDEEDIEVIEDFLEKF